MVGLQHGAFADLPAEEPYEGLERRTFSSGRSTVNAYTFAPGATFPLHRHAAEQITVVEEGSVEFTVGDERTAMAAGEWSVVAGDVEHGITAGPDGARILAIVSPRRESADELEVIGS